MCQHQISTAAETHSFTGFREKNASSASDQKGGWKIHWDILDFLWSADEWWEKASHTHESSVVGMISRGSFFSNRNTVIEHAGGQLRNYKCDNLCSKRYKLWHFERFITFVHCHCWYKTDKPKKVAQYSPLNRLIRIRIPIPKINGRIVTDFLK